MKRPLAIAVLSAVLILPLSLQAQYRQGARSFTAIPLGIAPVRMAPARLSPIRLRPGTSTFRNAPSIPFKTRGPKAGAAPLNLSSMANGARPGLAPGYFAGTPCYTNLSYSGSFFCSQFLNNRKPRFGAAAFAPVYWFAPMDYSQAEEAPQTQAEPDNPVVTQLQVLTDEVEKLREEQSALRDMPPREVEPSISAPEKPLKTVLVYRDGRQSEVQDYAILGKTLWIFAGQTTKKVALADLDLDLTRKLNDDRGVEFVSPGTM